MKGSKFALEIHVMWLYHTKSHSPIFLLCNEKAMGPGLVYWQRDTVKHVAYISRACNLSRIAKLSTSKFLELPIAISLSA